MQVDRAPQIMLPAIDPDEDLIEVPCVTGLWASAAQLVGIGLPELGAPPPDRLIADHDTAFEHHLLDITEAEREPEVQPHAVVDDLDRVAVTFVRRHCGAHASFSQLAGFNNVTVPALGHRANATCVHAEKRRRHEQLSEAALRSVFARWARE